jgi:NAD(P)H-hydrate epimerase
MKLSDLPVVRGVPSVTAAQMAEIDRLCASEFAIGVDLLMENASRQVAAAARVLLGGRVAGKRIVALVGPGNNGGDTAGALRYLVNWGANVLALLGAEQERLRDSTKAQVNRLLAATTSRSAIVKDATGMATLEIPEADLVLDGLLGFNAKGPPRGTILDLVTAANRSASPKLAVDLPSGLDADSGAAAGQAIHAAATVTLALPKSGLLAPAATALVGDLLLADIGVPHLAFAKLGLDTSRCFTEADLVRVTS